MDELEGFLTVLVIGLPALGALASRNLVGTILGAALCAGSLAASETNASLAAALWGLAWLGAYLPARAQERRGREESLRWSRIPTGRWHHWQRNLPGG